ncbi:MAG TPA: ATP-binding protein [Polyangiaceae bacterium]|jgi:signal transduction histidine kinase/CheY-like chemotaxis protein|nr:ATP-binding protein [Polyangiaceae bacterium]
MRDIEAAETPSLAVLREAILRRIMQAACVVGTVGLILSSILVRPFDRVGALIGVVAIVVVLSVTLVPRRYALLSLVYPWALAFTAVGIAWRLGPKAEPFLLACGALFIGSLVLEARQLAVLVVVALLGAGAAVHFSPQPFNPEVQSAWVNSTSAMLSVVLPASIAGRMIVSALARALLERTALIKDLLEQSRVREKTLEALDATRSQLTQAQKMELVGQMAGGIAHDMNNALTAIMGEASLLGDRAPESRERIEDAAGHAAKLTHQLMVFSRRDTSQPRPIDLSATIREQLKALRRLLTSEIALHSELPEEPVPIVADPTQLLQVLLNLAGNAKDAMEAGGTLTIVVRHERQNRRAVIEVRDTGAGIPAAILPNIFEPFYTTKPAGRGTGLGLANVKQLVVGMGGSVEVETDVGKGTTFVLAIPTTDEPIQARGRDVAGSSRASGTLLVVDDDVRVRATLYVTLERLGYRVLEAASPDATRALLANTREKIDLLLTDVVMAGGGGAKVIEIVTEKFPGARVLVMSGYNDDETLRRGIARGAYPFIAKPFTAATLARAIEAALRAAPPESRAPGT